MMFSAIAFQGPPTNSVASSIFKFLEKYQAQELILPFLITFVIVYGVLDTVKIFHKNSINGIIAISVSFFAIFYGPYGSMGKFLTQLYGTGAIAVIGIVLFMMILGAFSLGGTRDHTSGIFERLFGQTAGTVLGFVIAIVLIFLLATGWFENVGLKMDSDTTALVIIILVISLLFYLLTRSPDRYKQWWKGWQGTFGPPHQ